MSSYAEISKHRLPAHLIPMMKRHEADVIGHTPSNFDDDHMFHIMGKGWYIEISGGEVGPFVSQAEAARFLEDIS